MQASAQVYDAEGQYVDTVFHDHVNRQAEDFIQAGLVVCDPSDVLYSTLGHACLHLECPAFDKDFFFSYESEGVPHKVLTFLRGDLKMGMVAWEREDFLAMYAADGRGVREYQLNLTTEQEQALWYYLDQRVDEGVTLPYDYFHRGCAKAVVQVVKSALGQQTIHYGAWPERIVVKTQRELVADYITDSPWNEFILYFLVGTEGDWDCALEQKLIIPADLAEVWQHAEIGGKKLLASEARILVVPEEKESGEKLVMLKHWCMPIMVAIMLLLLTWWTPWPMLVMQTALGLLMAYLIGFSDLPCTTWNWLIIPFNPLVAIGWHWRRYWALPMAILLMVWLLVMAVYPHTLVGLPHVVLAAGVVLMLLKHTDWHAFCKRIINK